MKEFGDLGSGGIVEYWEGQLTTDHAPLVPSSRA